MLVFAYPKALHIRVNQPGSQYKSLKSYRPYVKAEFYDRCVYCRMVNLQGLSGAFAIDHYRPTRGKRAFPELQWAYSNMYWACHTCNSIKSSYWPEPAEEHTHFIPNPCDHRMFEHLKFDGQAVVAKSRAGETAIEVLNLNSDDRRNARSRLTSIASLVSQQVKEIREGLRKIEAKLAVGIRPAEEEQALSEKALKLRGELDRLVPMASLLSEEK